MVAGPGAIGLLTMQAVKSAGLRVIVLGTGVDEQRLQLANQLGADLVVDVQDRDPLSAVLEMTDGFGADIVYECSGAGAAAQQLLSLVRKRGQYAQVGLFGKPVAWDLDQLCYKELTVTGSNASVPSAWTRALKLMAEGKILTDPLATAVYPLADWRNAFEGFEQRKGVKFILRPNSD